MKGGLIERGSRGEVPGKLLLEGDRNLDLGRGLQREVRQGVKLDGGLGDGSRTGQWALGSG